MTSKCGRRWWAGGDKTKTGGDLRMWNPVGGLLAAATVAKWSSFRSIAIGRSVTFDRLLWSRGGAFAYRPPPPPRVVVVVVVVVVAKLRRQRGRRPGHQSVLSPLRPTSILLSLSLSLFFSLLYCVDSGEISTNQRPTHTPLESSTEKSATEVAVVAVVVEASLFFFLVKKVKSGYRGTSSLVNTVIENPVKPFPISIMPNLRICNGTNKQSY